MTTVNNTITWRIPYHNLTTLSYGMEFNIYSKINVLQ